MNIHTFYESALKLGLTMDPRQEMLTDKEKKHLKKLYEDTQIYHTHKAEVKKISVGIDIDSVDILLAHMKNSDAVISHHPHGKAFLNMWKTLDLYKLDLLKLGILKTMVENIIVERQMEYEIDAISNNYQKVIEVAKDLDITFLNVHTPADLLANNYVRVKLERFKDKSIDSCAKAILEIEEFHEAKRNGASPVVYVANKSNPNLGNYFVKFTGGSSKPTFSKTLFQHLREAGISTYICMDLPISQINEAREQGINIIICPHMATDSLGMNLMLDQCITDKSVEIIACGGFVRVDRRQD